MKFIVFTAKHYGIEFTACLAGQCMTLNKMKLNSADSDIVKLHANTRYNSK